MCYSPMPSTTLDPEQTRSGNARLWFRDDRPATPTNRLWQHRPATPTSRLWERSATTR